MRSSSLASGVLRPLVIATVLVVLIFGHCPRASAALPESALTVDQVVAVLAEVVAERAARVASRTMQRKVVGRLCGDSASKDGRELTLDWTDGKRAVVLGGKKDCKVRAACTADDVFVASCRRALKDDVSLTDAAFLKELTRDTVAFVLRLATIRIDAERFDELKMRAFADFVFRATDAVAKGDADLDALARALGELADELMVHPARDVVTAVGRDETTKQALLAVGRKLKDSCSAANDAVCALFKRSPHAYFSDDLFDLAKREQACTTFFHDRAARQDAFKAVYASAQLGPLKGKACPEANVKCLNAQAMFGWAQALQKAVCVDYSDDVRRDYRNLLYLLKEPALYPQGEATLDALAHHFAGPPPAEVLASSAVDPLLEGPDADALKGATAQTKTKLELATPYSELADAFRMISWAIAALRDNPDALGAWLSMLDDAVRAARTAPDPISALLRSPALDGVGRPASASVAALRDAVKNLVASPRFLVLNDARSVGQTEVAVIVRTAILDVVADVARTGRRSENTKTLLAHLEIIFGAFSRVFEATAKACGARPDAEAARAMSRSLDLTSQVLALAAERDWVGLSLRAGDELAELGEKDSLRESLRFVRVLMSSYQASTPDEAKTIMKSALENEASRENRFHDFTIDLGALLAFQGGYQWNTHARDTPPEELLADAAITGLYAPIGVQLAGEHIGALVYPLDLGAYLVANQAKTEPPAASAAVRFGGAVYVRPSKDIPIDLGGGVDYRPRFEERAEFRVVGFVALELPLFTIY